MRLRLQRLTLRFCSTQVCTLVVLWQYFQNLCCGWISGQDEPGLDQSLAQQQAPQGGPKGIPAATVAGGVQQRGAGATAREQALQPEPTGPDPTPSIEAEERGEHEGAQEQAAEVCCPSLIQTELHHSMLHMMSQACNLRLLTVLLRHLCPKGTRWSF